MSITLCCDTGIDDALAIAVARGLDLAVAAIVATAGNADLDTAARNTAGVVALCGIGAPVCRGPALPRSGRPHRSASFHGPGGLGGVSTHLPDGAPPREADLGALAGDLIVTGPLTVAAEALEAGAAIERLLWMGGAVHHPGNVTPHAEFNAWWDPHAVAEVAASGVALDIVPLDVTTTVVLRADDLRRLHEGGQTAHFCGRAAGYVIEHHDHMYAHDPATVLAYLRPELFTWERGTLSVDVEGERAGATRFTAGDGPHRVALKADVDTVRELILAAILACP
ncbi:MAG TPA: nucleoside hydrolase [Acidimicrobiales bacterium]